MVLAKQRRLAGGFFDRVGGGEHSCYLA
jgi:hypothetical protein